CGYRLQWDEGNELRRMLRRHPFLPRVARPRLRLAQPLEQTLPDPVLRVDRLFPHLLDPEALDEVVGAFEVVRVLAVVLEEELGGLERQLRRLDRREQIGLAHALPGCAADDDLPAALDADQTDVLHGRFSAIARAADRRHLHL